MSKESKPRDRWRQHYEATRDRPASWCRSCGYHPVVHGGAHRPDCALQGRCAGCGARLVRAASITAAACLECRLAAAPATTKGGL